MLPTVAGEWEPAAYNGQDIVLSTSYISSHVERATRMCCCEYRHVAALRSGLSNKRIDFGLYLVIRPTLVLKVQSIVRCAHKRELLVAPIHVVALF